MKIRFTKKYIKSYAKLTIKLRDKCREKVKILKQNPFDPILRNHELKGRYKGCRSINVTGDLRVIFREEKTDNIIYITFIDIGSHSKLY